MLFSLYQKGINLVVKAHSNLKFNSLAKYTAVCCLWDDWSDFFKMLTIFLIIIVFHIPWFWFGNTARKASWTILPVLVVANEVFLTEEEFGDKTEKPETFLWTLSLSVGLLAEQDNACRQIYSRTRSVRSSILVRMFEIAGAIVC